MGGAGDVLGRRSLNRATLARQLLLGRRELPVIATVERLLAERWPGHEPGPLAWSAQCLLPLVHPPPAAPGASAARRRSCSPSPGSAGRWPSPPRPGTWSSATWPRSAQPRSPTSRPGAASPASATRSNSSPPDPDTPAPPRFLPYFDNVLLAHADRTRIMSDDHRKRVCIGAVVEPTLLIDGQVVAIWRLVREPTQVILEVEPLDRVPATDLTAATREGERLLRFAAADAPDHDIRVLAPSPRGRQGRRGEPTGNGSARSRSRRL